MTRGRAVLESIRMQKGPPYPCEAEWDRVVGEVTRAYDKAKDRLGDAWLNDDELLDAVGARMQAHDRAGTREAIARWREAWLEFIKTTCER